MHSTWWITASLTAALLPGNWAQGLPKPSPNEHGATSSAQSPAQDESDQQELPEQEKPREQERPRERQVDDRAADQEPLPRPASDVAVEQPSDVPSPQKPPARVPTTRKPDRVNELIKTLDPNIINRLLGAEIQVEYVGGQVILKGPEEAVRTLELMIKALDQEAPVKVIRVVQVKERDANEIARQVQQALRDIYRTPAQREEEQITLTALTSTILLVGAIEEQIDEVLDVIAQVDEVPDLLGKIELMRFEVKNRRASDVAKELTKVLEQIQTAQGTPKGKSKLQIIPNNANNTISITAREKEREKIQSLIDEIDVEPKKGWGEVKLIVFPLLHSKATELSKVIEDLLKTQVKEQKEAVAEVIFRLTISKAAPTGEIISLPPIDLQKPIRIIADDGSQSLIVATIEENVGPMGELIRLLDGVPLAEGLDVRLFPMRFADAKSVGETLKKMFEDGKKLPKDPDGSAADAVPSGIAGRALVYNVGIIADVRSNTLVVSGRPEQLQLAEAIVLELDKPARGLKFPLRLIQMEYSDATRIGKVITELFDKRLKAAEATEAGKAAVERERVFLSVDIRSNSLIVSASEENFEEIVAIIRQLDVEPAKLFEQIRVINLQRLAAKDLKTKIDELWKRKAELMKADEQTADVPIIVADERSNSLVIASSMEDFQEIERLVQTLESQPLTESTRLFKLEFADAKLLADMLGRLFEGMAGTSEAFKKPTFLPDPRSNTLVVAATRDSMERVEELVRRLDIPGGPQTANIKVYPLEYGSAGKLAPRMQKLFDSRKEGDEQKRTPVVVFADEASNSVVASASRDDHAVVAELISVLDRPSSIARQFEIFPLKRAKAATVAEKLDALFATKSADATGRADAIAVKADERSNSLIVWASPSEMANIGEVVTRLDTTAPVVEMMVRVIQLKQALAEDFAKLLQETLLGEGGSEKTESAVILSFLDKDAEGREVVRRLLRQDIRIKPDARTNSLMVMAPADSMVLLEAMIRDFDKVRPIRSELRLFPLINSDAKSMVDKLTELFSPESKDGKTRRQFNFGNAVSEDELAAVGQDLRFTADTRTNTIIAAGAEVDLRMVEDLIRIIDAQQAEDRVVEVYQAKFRDAQDLATAVKGFVDQEKGVIGEGADQESQLRRQQRQVSVESLGAVDKGSSNLIVGSSPQNYQRTMEMISGLDRPEPQVMISVLIAEVTLSNNVELGVEIAGQQLNFSDSSVVGPNGIIQGSDFDFVGGTDIGAAGLGLGGFNFTITGEDFSFLLHALQGDSRLEILSRPILMVRNGEEGKITIADEVPIVQSSQLNTTGQTQSTIGREDVGIVLTTTPHISPDGYVTIALKQEISNISGENLQLTEGVSSPIFAKREVETNVTVRDGETVVVGGLIQSRDSEGENKVPLLGDIPILGVLFRSTNVTHSKTELLMVLTVDILRTDEDVRKRSIEQRDKYTLPDSVVQHPFMEGLRILPENEAIEHEKPCPTTPVQPAPPPPAAKPREEREQFGPKPKTYGPVISRTAPISTAQKNVYGPRIVRRESPAAP